MRSYGSEFKESKYLEGTDKTEEVKDTKKKVKQTIFTPEGCIGRSTVLIIALLPIILYVVACSSS